MSENTVVLLVMLGVLALCVVLSAIVPNISRPTVPLGVDVPRARIGDPVVRTALRTYRVWCVALGVVAAVGLWLTRENPLWGSTWVLLYVFATLVVYAVARRPIQRAKAEQGWYDGAQVRVTASVTRDEPRPVRVAWPVHALALGLVAAALIASVWAYPTLPDPFPVHHDALGHPDRFEPKTWGAVLFGPLMAAISALVILGLCVVMVRRNDPRLPDGDPAGARAASDAKNRGLQVALAWTSVATSVLLAGTTAVQIGRLSQTFLTVVTVVGIVAVFIPVLWLTVRTARLQKAASATPRAPGPDSPDDDRHWKWGQFYYNTDDPRVMVEKRNGIGLTVNAGHPAGMAFLLVSLVLVLFTLSMPLWITP